MKCKHCTHKDECADDAFINDAEFALDVEHECAGFEPFTNADRIRAMTDEELAELFGSIVDDGMSCSLICGDLDKCKRNKSIERICKNHYLKWLQQPAEGE